MLLTHYIKSARSRNVLVGIMLLFTPQIYAYPHVHITNKTKFEVYGDIHYKGGSFWGCGTQTYHSSPYSSFDAPSRGACLISKISVNAYDIGAGTPYTSSGTGFASFVIFKTDSNNLMITHI